MGRSANGESKLAAGLMPGRTVLQRVAAKRDAANGSSGGRGNFLGPLGGAPQEVPVAPMQPSAEDRQSAINARILAAKAATGQGANVNGTTNAMSTAVARPQSSYMGRRGGK